MPITSESTSAPDHTVSMRMPATFLPFNRISLGHLICGASPSRVSESVNESAARPTVRERSAPPEGRMIRLTARAAPLGVNHFLLRRPRPAVCSSATTREKSAAPFAAHARASSFVEPMDSKYRISLIGRDDIFLLNNLVWVDIGAALTDFKVQVRAE